MIGKQELLKTAKLFGLRPWQQEKHYVQAVVLNTLAEEAFVFKGGTYLWFFHGLQRFSEDLDFTTQGEPVPDLAQEVSEALRLFGVENTVKKIESSARTVSFRLAAKGPLNTSDKDLCFVYVEASLREKVLRQPLPLKLDFPAYGLPVKMIEGMALEEVAAEKVRAIMTRDKARDVHDLDFLASKGATFDAELAKAKLSYYGLDFSGKEFAEKLADKGDYWRQELEPLVFGDLADFKAVEKRLLRWVGKR